MMRAQLLWGGGSARSGRELSLQNIAVLDEVVWSIEIATISPCVAGTPLRAEPMMLVSSMIERH